MIFRVKQSYFSLCIPTPTPRHEATRVQQSDSTELVEVEADPLDAFMSNMEDELTKEPWVGRVDPQCFPMGLVTFLGGELLNFSGG